jgi:hypothetical protein
MAEQSNSTSHTRPRMRSKRPPITIREDVCRFHKARSGCSTRRPDTYLQTAYTSGNEDISVPLRAAPRTTIDLRIPKGGKSGSDAEQQNQPKDLTCTNDSKTSTLTASYYLARDCLRFIACSRARCASAKSGSSRTTSENWTIASSNLPNLAKEIPRLKCALKSSGRRRTVSQIRAPPPAL